MRARPWSLGALALLAPATALANPGPNPASAKYFLVVIGAQFVCGVFSSVVSVPGDDGRWARVTGIVLTIVGVVGSLSTWEGALLFLAPAAVLQIIGAFGTAHRSARALAVIALVVSLIGIPWGIQVAREPWFWRFSPQVKALGGEEPLDARRRPDSYDAAQP